MKMQLELEPNGSLCSAFGNALRNRKVDLSNSAIGPHPVQALAAASRRVTSTLDPMLNSFEKIGEVPFGDYDGGDLMDAFRNFIYSTSEMFDIYAKLIPSIVESKYNRKMVKNYSEAVKRLRKDSALLCNRMKHECAQLTLVRLVSVRNSACGYGYTLFRYQDGDSLRIDKEVHQKGERSVSLLRKWHEIFHSLLRADLNAAKLIEGLPEDPNVQPINAGLSFKWSEPIGRIAQWPIVLASYEPAEFDGVEITPDRTIALTRRTGIRMSGPTRVSTSFIGDGLTNKFELV